MVFLQYLTTVFDSIEEAIILVNVEPEGKYRLLMANDAFYRQSGYDRETTIGELVEKIVTVAGYKDLIQQYTNVVKTKKQVEFKRVYSVPLGKVSYQIKLIPILNAVGETIQIAGIIHDVSEVERLRQQVKKTNETLHKLTEQLTDL